MIVQRLESIVVDVCPIKTNWKNRIMLAIAAIEGKQISPVISISTRDFNGGKIVQVNHMRVDAGTSLILSFENPSGTGDGKGGVHS